MHCKAADRWARRWPALSWVRRRGVAVPATASPRGTASSRLPVRGPPPVSAVSAAISKTRAGSRVVRFARGFPRKVTRLYWDFLGSTDFYIGSYIGFYREAGEHTCAFRSGNSWKTITRTPGFYDWHQELVPGLNEALSEDSTLSLLRSPTNS